MVNKKRDFKIRRENKNSRFDLLNNKIKRLKSNRSAASHIEVILSFVIFLGFLIFILAIFNPFTSSSKGSNLNNVERAIKDYANVELEFITLSLEKEPKEEKCFYFSYQLKDNIFIKNEFSIAVHGINENGSIYINNSGKFFYIYSSKEFNKSFFDMTGCKELKKEDKEYSLGLYRNYSLISYHRLENLKKAYDENYNKLKTDLRIKGNFAFSIRDTSNNKIIFVDRKGQKIYTKDIPIQIAYQNGRLKYAIMNIQTWS